MSFATVISFSSLHWLVEIGTVWQTLGFCLAWALEATCCSSCTSPQRGVYAEALWQREGLLIGHDEATSVSALEKEKKCLSFR